MGTNSEYFLCYHDSSLRQDDLKLLEVENSWLNDVVIACILEYFEHDLFKEELQQCTDVLLVCPSVAQLASMTGASPLLKDMLSPISLSTRKLIFFPVNNLTSRVDAGGSHWSLLLFVRGNLSSTSTSSLFLHFDSLNGLNNDSAYRLANAVAPLLLENDVKLRSVWRTPSCPQQENGWDCGIYVLAFIEMCLSRWLSDDNFSSDTASNNRFLHDFLAEDALKARRRYLYALLALASSMKNRTLKH